MSQVLGRGLGSLIPKKTINLQNNDSEQSLAVLRDEDRIIQLSPAIIKPNPYQPRQLFTASALKELIDSIREHGIFQPLIVSQQGENFQLIAGERRLRAALELGLEKVPVIIRQVNEQKKLELSLVENLQRQDLNPLESARAYQRLIDEFNLSQEEVANKVGKARSSLANTLRLLSLPTIIQQAIADGRLSEAHAKYLLGLSDSEQQLNIFKKILRHNLSVSDTDQEIKRLGGTKSARVKYHPKDQQQEEFLSSSLGTKVEIKRRRRGGCLIINFYSEEDLTNIINKINN